MSAAVRRGVRPAMLLAIGCWLLAGCGSASLSDHQLRIRASRICTAAEQRTAAITQPSTPGQASRFLSEGVTALSPQMTALGRLRPSTDLRGDYQRALATGDRELALLRSAQTGLRGDDDPVVAIRALQQQLATVEQRASTDWRAVGLSACAALLG